MRQHGLGHLIADPESRKLLWETILATDMSVHEEFMKRFKEPEVSSQDVLSRKILVSQAIIKCADISNPSRPYHVATHWARALTREWLNQASLEKTLEVPLSVPSNDDDLSEAGGQVFFITTFVKPLFELVASRVPGEVAANT